MQYTEQLTQHLQRIQEVLPQYLPAVCADCTPVPEAMAYACADGGKRLRPVLVLEWCRLCGGDTEAALPFACAIEMIHNYSLIHDDLPCMDNSPLRRGKPSVQAAYGETMALLSGDALLNRAFEVMLSDENTRTVSPKQAMKAAWILAQASGIEGMIGGQVMDLRCEGQQIDLEQLVALQAGKTAALISAACRMGAVLGGGDETRLQAAATFGYELGLAFQIVDDILDVTSTAQVLGKPVGSDAVNEKVTYVSLVGLDEARRMAAARTQAALAALEPFGDEAASLRRLAADLQNRSM